MTLNVRLYAVTQPVKLTAASLQGIPVATRIALETLERSVNTALELVPQAADAAPLSPRIGTQRLAVPPWLPLGGSTPVWVWWDGSNWVAL